MPPKRFCQLCLRLTRRRKNLKPESALSESLSPARLMHGEIPPSGFASFIYSPVSDYTHAAPKQNNSLGGKKNASRTHLGCCLSSGGLSLLHVCDIIAVDSRKRETFLRLQSLRRSVTNIWARSPANNTAAKVAIVSQHEMTNQVCWVKTSSHRGILFPKGIK